MHARWAIIILITVLPASADQYVLPPQNYRHWQRLDKICDTGRKTYGTNEFLENGQVCRWVLVPYWPADRAAWDAARAAERRAEK